MPGDGGALAGGQCQAASHQRDRCRRNAARRPPSRQDPHPLAGDRKLAGRLLAGGTATWALSKLVKRIVRRPRPAILLPATHRRGPDAAGLGYLSGHAGVAVALGAAALPRLGPAARVLTVTAIPAVGLSRVYVGAHLPLDIAGGAALGLAIDAALALAQGHATPPAPREARQVTGWGLA